MTPDYFLNRYKGHIIMILTRTLKMAKPIKDKGEATMLLQIGHRAPSGSTSEILSGGRLDWTMLTSNSNCKSL
jgi:hypothetical protein